MEVFFTWWPVLLAVIGSVVWFVRVESKTMSNANEIERLWKQRDEDQRNHKEARDSTNQLLTEMRSDIKLLLTHLFKKGD